MAARLVAGSDARDLERNYGFAEQGNDPTDGADKARAAFAGPVHALRERRLQNQLGERRGKDIQSRAAGDFPNITVFFVLAVGNDFESVNRDALFAREAFHGGRGR